MKKISTIIYALALSLVMVSCVNELENPRKGVNDFNTFYANATADDAENSSRKCTRLISEDLRKSR